MHEFFEVRPSDWRSFLELAGLQGSFYFRGQGSAAWPLASSFQREYYRYKPDRIGAPPNAEHWMLHDFKQKFHLYSSAAPHVDDDFEWLALMQHHGAPTRLVDFTLSVYVAAFFAMESATEDACIWAINWPHIRDHLRELGLTRYDHTKLLRDSVNRLHVDLLNAHIGEGKPRNAPIHVVPVQSKRLSERAARQEGIFLAPLNIGWVEKFVSFEENLSSSFGSEKAGLNELHRLDVKDAVAQSSSGYWSSSIKLMKVILPREMHVAGLTQLRSMGITRERLFPGLDGLASSLAMDHLRIR